MGNCLPCGAAEGLVQFHRCLLSPRSRGGQPRSSGEAADAQPFTAQAAEAAAASDSQLEGPVAAAGEEASGARSAELAAAAAASRPAGGPRRPWETQISRWGHLEDSDDEALATPTAEVCGFVGREESRLNGTYTAMPWMNHGSPVFRRSVLPASPSRSDGMMLYEAAQVVLYFWDDRDGFHLCGWWFGPDVGSNTVWAFNPGLSWLPPVKGWQQPWFASICQSATVALTGPQGLAVPKPMAPCPAEALEEALRETLAPRLELVVESLRGVPTAWRCVDCLGWLDSPVALPCGHMVCSSHAKAGGETYRCPWTVSCAPRRYPPSQGPESWRVSGLANGLLELLPTPPEQHAPTASSRSADEAADALEAVCSACRPKQIVTAYEALGDLHGRRNRVAEAAVAFSAARFMHQELGGAIRVGEKQLSEHAEHMAPDHQYRAVHMQKTLRVKASAWVKRCGERAALAQAARALPMPERPAGGDLESVEGLAARLREAAGEAELANLCECPICYRTVFEPVTTPCGHTFCGRCLARTLDWDNDCPLCRGSLQGSIDHYAVCEPLQALLAALWPEEYGRQRQALEDEAREQREGGWLPVFQAMMAFPTQPCNIHVFEPRYRLLIRQALASGTRRFGACAWAGDAGGLPEYGTELLLGRVHVLADGRSLVETAGGRRFRVLEVQEMEGSIRAKVEYLADDPDGAPTSEQREEFVAVVRSCAPFLHEVLGHRFAAEGGTEPGDADVAVWALLGQLPLPAEAKYRFLAMPSCSARMAALTGALQDFHAMARAA